MNANRATRFAALLLAVAGVALTLFLTWAHFSGSLGAICSETGGCGEVLTSSYAQFLGLPTAFYGFVYYFTVAVLLVVFPFVLKRTQSNLLSALVGLNGAALTISLALTGWSLTVLDSLCGYCVTSTILVFLLFGVTLFWKIRDARMHADREPPGTVWKVSVAGLAVLFLTVGGLYVGTDTRAPVDADQEKMALAAEKTAIGNPQAPIRVVEFFDLACPHCQRFALNTFPEIRENYINNGDVVWIFRHMPIARSHPHSPRAHSLLSLVSPDRFAEAKKRFMEDADQWAAAATGNPTEYFDFFAQRYGLPTDEKTLNRRARRIMNRRSVAAEIGVRSTPSFLVNGKLYQGAKSYENFQRIFDEILEASEQ